MIIEKDLYKNIENITGVDYEGIELRSGMLIRIDVIESIMKDLVVEYNRKLEELEEQEEHCREYHKEKDIDYYYEYGISEKDFH